jgi:hypothetical protein
MAAIVSNVPLAGQNIGLVLPPLNDDRLFYGLALGLLVIATAVVWWLTRSRFGFGLIAIRENEDGAAVMGVNTTLYKVLAFALSGVLSSLAGGIHAYWITFLDPERVRHRPERQDDHHGRVRRRGHGAGAGDRGLHAVGHLRVAVQRGHQHRHAVLRRGHHRRRGADAPRADGLGAARACAR